MFRIREVYQQILKTSIVGKLNKEPQFLYLTKLGKIIHSASIRSTYDVSNVLGSGHKAVNKEDPSSCSYGMYILVEENTQ